MKPDPANLPPPAVRLDTSLELLLERAPADSRRRVLATVVATAGSTYRKPGARMLIMDDGSSLGLLSGGCLESDLMLHARTVIDGGGARVVEYDMRGPDDVLFGIGAGCEGAMRVLLEPAGPGSQAAAALAAAGRATAAGEPASLLMIHDAAGIRLGTHAQPPPGSAALFAAVARGTATGTTCAVDVVEDGRRVRALLQQLAPPPLLLVCGAGPDAQPVVGAARSLGWRVAVVDHRPAYAAAERFPGATVHCAPADSLRHTIDLARCHAAVVMSHHLVSDTAYLRALAAAGMPGYVGLLGPAARRGRLAADLGDAARLLEHRLRGPVGVDIGAATPEGIALSIIAQVHAWLAGRAAGDAGMAGLALQESAK